MVLPGIASTWPRIQLFICGCAISAGESCARGDATRSSIGSGKCRAANSLNFLAMVRKICQSLFDFQQGGTAPESGWMKLCMSVEFRSAFPYEVAAGPMLAEYSPEVPLRKF